MQGYWKTSELEGENAAYLEGLYESYLESPDSVDPKWRIYFDSVKGTATEVNHSDIREAFVELAKYPQVSGMQSTGENGENAYRKKGHLLADIDPLKLLKKPSFEEAGLDSSLQAFKATYCGTIGYEYAYIENESRREWLRKHIEENQKPLSLDQKKWLLKQLTAADGIEKCLGTRYVGQKRFSLEGGDAFIPLMNAIIAESGNLGAEEVVIGMAHRGRLNVLINVMGKAPNKLFDEFEGKHSDDLLAGDVKYHNGFSSEVKTPGGKKVHLALAFNPSHLEIVSPVVEGSVHARQYRRHGNQDEVLAIQVHGDAAFAGQGCVYESLNMAETKGFTNGGSIHVVINNQVGFTTSPTDARSTRYCTDIAKMFEAPVLHVNGNDPEAVYLAAQLAALYRKTFKLDVYIDLVCYRRHGHNESDEPTGTQPLMYQVIKNMPVPAKIYADRLVSEKTISESEFTTLQQEYKKALDAGSPVVELMPREKKTSPWKDLLGQDWRVKYESQVSQKELLNLAKALNQFPQELNIQTQVLKAIQDRMKMAQGEIPFNWGGAEILAYATLLTKGLPVRLSGEDVGRGTFSHRHAVIKDQKTGEVYIPLNHVDKEQAQFTVIDSTLSEESALGFEYGYAGAMPDALGIWEAQFGDFVNCAQVIIDQFISAAEEKWGKLCALTMLLPHGQEGMGPEHSSARLERFLQLCAHDNMQVCAPTTPAQIYHLLRRQVLRPYRKPLVIMSPKSLLRHPLVTSTLDELAEGTFLPIIGEIDALKASKVRRVVICQGKVYYDLLAKRRDQKCEDIAIVRIEQMYPFPDQELKGLLKDYAHVKDWVWCQEEPENQGAWFKLRNDLADIGLNCRYVGRQAYASPAVGYASVFKEQQEQLVQEALT